MAYFLDSIKFIAGSVKYGTTDKIELRADLVEYINEINFEKVKEYLEAKFGQVGYCCSVDRRLYTTIYGQGRRIKMKIKKLNSGQKHRLRESTWHSFSPTEEFSLNKIEVCKLCIHIFTKILFFSA